MREVICEKKADNAQKIVGRNSVNKKSFYFYKIKGPKHAEFNI